MAASMECLKAPMHTPSSPDRSQLVPLALDYTRLSSPKPNRELVRRLAQAIKFFLQFSNTEIYNAAKNGKYGTATARKVFMNCSQEKIWMACLTNEIMQFNSSGLKAQQKSDKMRYHRSYRFMVHLQ